MRQVVLVDEHDQVIGKEDLFSAHRHPAKLHRAISVWLFRGTQILFQQRSVSKIVGAGQWGNGVCGNVAPGQSYQEAAKWRLEVELGLEDLESLVLQPIYRFKYQVWANPEYGEHELDQVYLAAYDQSVHPNPDEVNQVAWVELAELKAKVFKQKSQIVSAIETLNFSTTDLKEVTKPLEIVLNNQTYFITPWTTIMLGDDRLWTALDKIA